MSEWISAGKVRMTPRGIYDSTISYEILDLVSNSDKTAYYIAKQNVPIGTSLSNTTYWECILNANNAGDLIAPAYEEISFPVIQGQYCTYSGNLYISNQDILSTETWTSSHWIEITLGKELVELKKAITYDLGYPIIQMIDNQVYYIINGEQVNLTPTTSSYYRSALVPCTAGDQFVINATGYAAGRPWAFIDSDRNIISASTYVEEDVTVTDLHKTAPTNAAYLIINDRKTNTVSYTGRPINDKIEELTVNIMQKTVTPLDYGAKADGITDDTNAINSCISDAISNNFRVIFPHGIYAVTNAISVNGSVYIDGQHSTILYTGAGAGETSVINVTAGTTPGKRGVMENFVLKLKDPENNSANPARYGLKVTQNINAFIFKNFQINNLGATSIGVYAPSTGGGKFFNFIIRCEIQSENYARGFVIECPDTVIKDAIVINCYIGISASALIEIINFHPWNSYSDLMTRSIGISASSLVVLTNSYIDTFAKCFSGSGYFCISGLICFWEPNYYTDESVGDETTLPVIFSGSNIHVVSCEGMRVYPARGRTDQHIKFNDSVSAKIYFNPRINNLLESVTNINPVSYTTKEFTYSTGTVGSQYDTIHRYEDRVVVYAEMKITDITVAPSKGFATLPSDCIPKTQKVWVCSAYKDGNTSKRAPVEVLVNGSTGNMQIRSMFEDLEGTYVVTISEEYIIR